MKFVLFGASGTIGQRILREALSRGHIVTAVARDPSRVTEKGSNVRAVRGDVLNPRNVAALVEGHDVVISAFGPGADQDVQSVVQAARSLIAGLMQAGVRRLAVVGGAGSLEVAPGVKLQDVPDFPAALKGIAGAHTDALEVYRSEAGDLEWTYLSPAALIEPGKRTGKFRLGGDAFLADDQGQSRISAEDYAVGLIDEIENPRHIKQRFTVAY